MPRVIGMATDADPRGLLHPVAARHAGLVDPDAVGAGWYLDREPAVFVRDEPEPAHDCGDAHAWPNADGYVPTPTILHQGWLIGPTDADFDLVLEVWQGRRWRFVASSTGAGSTEELHYVGRAVTYRWGVVSERGSGAYELYLSLP